MLLIKRDGNARIGKVRFEDREFETPLMLDFLKEDFKDFIASIDFGIAPYVLKDVDPERFNVMGSKDERFVILTGLKYLSPKKLVDTFAELKTLKAVYTPAFATPINLPILIYLGVDIVDNIIPIIDAYKGIYYTNDSKFELKELKNLPCMCPVCLEGLDRLRDAEYEERSNLIALHNTFVMQSQIEQIKELIKRENLRNYVEARVKLNPELTTILRFADASNYCFKFHANFKRSKVYFNTLESFNRFEVKIFFEKALKAYKPKTKTALILPCTAKKPYLISRTHSTLRSRCKVGVNEIIVSSPLVVPREFELVYPAINYDTPVTGYWSEEEISFVAQRLRAFIEVGGFEHVIAHVEGGYRRVVEKALKDYDVYFTCDGSVTSKKSLYNLKKVLEDKNEKFNLYREIFKHMAVYQFDIELGFENAKIKGRYPDLEMILDERILRVDKRYGMLDIYYHFAKRLIDAGKYFVKIGDFTPKGTIFAVGVEDSDREIKPNDIVVFYNDKIFGVGRAVMAGWEMVEAESGVALVVKRKWKKST